MSRFGRRSLAVAAGLLLDRVFGEPPAAVHPVADFGRVMLHLERTSWADRRGAGVRYTAIGIALGAGAGALGRSTAGAVALTSAGRELRRVAAGIGDQLIAGDLEAARAALPSLVGRDPSELDASGGAAAVIESLAENTVDAVVASAFWGLVAGAPGAGAYRAINTMDAMVGHHSARHERFGWAAARTDDVANLLPARLFALLVAAQVPGRAAEVWRIVRRDAGAHPSPNAGVAEAAVAAALGRQLGGPLRYGERLEERPRLGDGPRPGATDVVRARELVDRVEWSLIGLLVAVAVVDHLRDRRA